jgi:hypothetical protein
MMTIEDTKSKATLSVHSYGHDNHYGKGMVMLQSDDTDGETVFVAIDVDQAQKLIETLQARFDL